MWVASFKIPCVIFWGYAGFMPDPSLEITVVVGKGIELPKIPQPTVEEVDRWHGVYIKALEATFYKHAPKYCDLRSCDIVGQTNSPQFGSATLKIR
mmetsp:Transcript_67139/g.212532  ORF Transcript_67139/g.212532 Transcript_67139/m.212532 type:complete len:96 (+) Transcript_67139:2386-2673(+)